MGIVYHGSKTHYLKIIEPHKSTHGEYVYATPFREIAILFSKRCGDNLVYGFGRNDKSEPFDLVERIPNALKFMYMCDSSIYTLDDSTFKNINTSFGKNEVVSDGPIEVLNEEYIPNLFDELENLEKSGFIRIYKYPNRPDYIPRNDLDLLEKEINHLKNKDIDVNKNNLSRLVYLHPNLLEDVNEVLYGLDEHLIDECDLVEIFNYYKGREDVENYFTSAYELLKKYCPEVSKKVNVNGEISKTMRI